MANQTINIGTTANDGTGDQLRDAFDKTNDNFLEIYTGTASVARQTVPATVKGLTGDVAGMIATDATSIWVCYATWTDGVADIWIEADIAASDTHIANAALHFTEGSITLTESQISDLNTRAVPTLPHGVTGDTAGMIAMEAGWLYLCILDYVPGDATVSWQRVAIASTNPTTW